jgi:hypothetical protein
VASECREEKADPSTALGMTAGEAERRNVSTSRKAQSREWMCHRRRVRWKAKRREIPRLRRPQREEEKFVAQKTRDGAEIHGAVQAQVTGAQHAAPLQGEKDGEINSPLQRLARRKMPGFPALRLARRRQWNANFKVRKNPLDFLRISGHNVHQSQPVSPIPIRRKL